MSTHKNECTCFEEGIDYPAQKTDTANFETDDQALLAARKAFGITYLFPWQRIVIANILDSTTTQKCEETDLESNSRQIVLLPTGAGKSLCFLTPAILLDGPTLVLYPLLALMSDQKRRMDEGGIPSVIFKGGMTEKEYAENFIKIRNGAKIILANPEVLQNRKLVAELAKHKISHIAIDEAHCVSEWGDSFRPAYLTLGKIIKELQVPCVTAFTATASPQVLSRISEVLFEGEAHIVRSESDRPNIHYFVVNTFSKKKTALLMAMKLPKPLIIFCGTRKKSEDMAHELAPIIGTDKVKFYHAGLEREEKSKVEKWFYPKTDAILCCTCAFGMGVDKKDIHTVIHLEPSPTAESYIQEAGRGGRDGSIANAYLLWSPEDSMKASKLKDDSRNKVMSFFAESTTCRRQILLDALGGEKVFCEGCDICISGKPPEPARDAGNILEIIRKKPNQLTVAGLNNEAIEKLNEKSLKEIGWCIYDHSDTQEIISNLEKLKLIRVRKFPWQNTICLNRKSAKTELSKYFQEKQ